MQCFENFAGGQMPQMPPLVARLIGESRAVSGNSNFGLRLQLQASKIFGTGSNL